MCVCICIDVYEALSASPLFFMHPWTTARRETSEAWRKGAAAEPHGIDRQ